MKKPVILITGAYGQIGTELTAALRKKYGDSQVIATDIRPKALMMGDPHYQRLDVLNKQELDRLIVQFGVTQIYHLAAMLSAAGEKEPLAAWNLNMGSLLHVLEAARLHDIERVFWPSSIAVFGPSSERAACPQHTVMEPKTMYGISKLAGEQLCQYYQEQYGTDVRSLRYPGLISYRTPPGGGTTDYAVSIFYEALSSGNYACFLKEYTTLPMLYMPDAIRATLRLMEAPAEKISIRSAYNLWGMSFSPHQLANEIRRYIPDFEITYAPDFRQHIADSWPSSIDDRHARRDRGWTQEFDMAAMVRDMLMHLDKTNKVIAPEGAVLNNS